MENSKPFPFHPLLDRVVILADNEDEKTKGGIFIPETSRTPQNTGVILAVGPGRTNARGDDIPLHVKKGDRVFFQRGSGVVARFPAYGDVDVLIMSEIELLGIVPPEPEQLKDQETAPASTEGERLT